MSSDRIAPDYDALYQRLFSHPGVVAQLLRGFIDGALLDGLDLDAMQRLNTRFHADTVQRRDGDMIWRIPRHDGADTYLVLLLEFQSTQDRYMAVRVLAYAALMWQQLIREVRLEKAADPAQVVADAVLAWLARHPGFSAARAAFAALLGTMMAPLGPGMRMPEDLQEVRNMLAARAEEWIQGWRQEGREEGRREGRLEGRREGRLEGEAAVILRLLERRFGALPDWVMDRVLSADHAAVEEWTMRTLDAGSLDDVFRA